jgi:P27 family predicted phage terminase small subunit
MGSRGPISHAVRGLPNAGHGYPNRTCHGAPVSASVPEAGAPPSAPSSLHAAGRDAWGALWASSPWLWSDVDQLLAAQWAALFDERRELLAALSDTGRTARGSMGQPVTHPVVDQLRQVENSMLKLGAVLGVGPQNAARLGISVETLRRGIDPETAREKERIMERYRAHLSEVDRV